MSILFTSDLHWRHEAMTRNGWRPFQSIEVHDETLINNWNSVVTKRDQVWVLGDWTGTDDYQGSLDIVQRLNGEIHLITGNHDPGFPGHRNSHRHQREYLEAGFASVQAFARRRIGKKNLLLSHFPYEGDHTGEDRYDQWRLRDEGEWLLHGHVHDAWKVRGRQINVGVDVWGFKPVPMHEIQKIIGEVDEQEERERPARGSHEGHQ